MGREGMIGKYLLVGVAMLQSFTTLFASPL